MAAQGSVCFPGRAMLTVVGFIVVTVAILGGFSMAGGSVGSLIHPSEIVIIGGASMGAMIVMAPKKVLIDLLKGMLQCFKGSPFNRKAYEELFSAMYELARLARRADAGGEDRGVQGLGRGGGGGRPDDRAV